MSNNQKFQLRVTAPEFVLPESKLTTIETASEFILPETANETKLIATAPEFIPSYLRISNDEIRQPSFLTAMLDNTIEANTECVEQENIYFCFFDLFNVNEIYNIFSSFIDESRIYEFNQILDYFNNLNNISIKIIKNMSQIMNRNKGINFFLNFNMPEFFNIHLTLHTRKNNGSFFFGSGAFVEGDFIHIVFKQTKMCQEIKIKYKIKYLIDINQIEFILIEPKTDQYISYAETIIRSFEYFINIKLQNGELQIYEPSIANHVYHEEQISFFTKYLKYKNKYLKYNNI